MKDEWRIFAERVKKLLDARGISQRELADEVGITEVTMSRYITAERVPSATLIPSFAKALHVTCDYLIGVSDVPYGMPKGMPKGIVLDVNNGQTLFLSQVSKDGDTILDRWDGTKMEYERSIPAGDMVMLLNFYRYVKDNDIYDSFINPEGKNNEGVE
jgi:transcriptional regulator with XRE-family HTH domain